MNYCISSTTVLRTELYEVDYKSIDIFDVIRMYKEIDIISMNKLYIIYKLY